jgi:3-oxoacyl-[acyl-carrier-protein] synthase-3
MDVYIKHIEYYLPEQVLTNVDINRMHPEWEVDKISKKTGIYERRIASKNEFASDMAVSAAEKLINIHGINRSKIDFIVYCTQSADYFLPTTACILQNKLKLNIGCGAIDLNQGCSGYVYGLAICKGLIESGAANNILFITAETYSKYINPNDKSNKTIFGDAATATLLSNETGYFKLLNFSFGTNGEGAENLIVRNGASRFRYSKGLDIFDESNNYVKNDDNLFMNGKEIFSFTSKEVPLLVSDVLEKNNQKINQIDYFVFHQANKFMLDFIRKKMNIEPDKFIEFLKNVGNTVSNTIPIALNERCFVKKGKFLLIGFGVGYSWAGCIIETNDIS